MYCYQYSIDATEESDNFGRLINHSKANSNLDLKVVAGDRPCVCMFAKVHLQAGVELAYDYGERAPAVLKLFQWLKE